MSRQPGMRPPPPSKLHLPLSPNQFRVGITQHTRNAHAGYPSMASYRERRNALRMCPPTLETATLSLSPLEEGCKLPAQIRAKTPKTRAAADESPQPAYFVAMGRCTRLHPRHGRPAPTLRKKCFRLGSINRDRAFVRFVNGARLRGITHSARKADMQESNTR